MNEQEPHKYLVFDTDQPNLTNGLKLNKTTKKHVKAVAMVQAMNSSLTDISRAKYAKQAGLHRGDLDKELPDVFDEFTAAAALAEVLFAGCPELLNEEGEIINQALFDCLDEGAVNRGFLDFQLQRSGTKHAQLNSLST